MKTLPRHASRQPLPEPAVVADPRHQCPLCGYRFVSGREVCSSCGLGGACEAIGCPHCGYQFPLESTTLSWMRRQLRRLTGWRRHGA